MLDSWIRKEQIIRWVLLLVDGQSILQRLTIRCNVLLWVHHPPQEYWNIEITNAWQGHEVWTLAGQTTKFMD